MVRLKFVPPAKEVYRLSAGETCAPAPRKLFPDAGKGDIHSLSKKMYRFSRRRGKLCPGAGKAVPRRRGKVTFMHYRRKMCKFSRRRGKLCLGAEKSHSFAIQEKCVGFPGAGGSCVLAPESSGARFWRGSGARLQTECRFSRRRGKLFPGAERAASRRRVNIEEKCVGFPGAGGSCAPAPGKLFPDAGEGHIHSVSKKKV